MNKTVSKHWICWLGIGPAKAILFLLVLLVVNAIGASDSRAHQVFARDAQIHATDAAWTAGTPALEAAVSFDEIASAMGLSAGCPHTGLDAPIAAFPDLVWIPDEMRHPLAAQPIRAVAHTPPSPPPNHDLRCQID